MVQKEKIILDPVNEKPMTEYDVYYILESRKGLEVLDNFQI